MILRLVHAGAGGSGPLEAAAEDYRRRLGRHFRVEEAFVKPVKLRSEAQPEVERALHAEAERLSARVGPRDVLVALAIDGEPLSSAALADQLARWMNEGPAAVCFALGSAHGLAPTLARAARLRWSFGPLTLPHDLARVVLWEQLYRASTILRGEPYHK